MNLLQDIITYVRRIVKTPSNASLSDNLIIDYINRFWVMDVDARLQMFDLKTKYSFQTSPGVSEYNMPLYGVNGYTNTEPGQTIGPFPVYQGFLQSSFVNGIEVPLYTERSSFYKIWPNYIQNLAPAGTATAATTYSLNLPFFPAIQGHVDITGIILSGSTVDPIVGTSPNTSVPITSVYPGVWVTATDTNGANMVVTDSGQFLSSNVGYGLLINQDGTALTGGYSTTSNTVNYSTGVLNVTFPRNPQPGTNINVQCYFYQQGIPRAILFYNNCISLRPPPDIQYLVELDAYLSPAAFFTTSNAIPFGYMAEYIARGAARKILSDTGDAEQFMFYEGLFREQEMLVWKRSQRQFTANRTGTIFSDLQGPQSNFNNIGQGAN